jgi:hypothetical protein
MIAPMRLLALIALLAAAGSAHAGTGLVHFRSPSGNINCVLGASFADCLVRHDTWPRRPTKPASCDLDFNPAEVAVTPGGVVVGACRGDVGPLCGLSDDRCVVLRYGRSLVRGRIRCTSALNGVTCRRVNGRRVGFLIARERYVLYR